MHCGCYRGCRDYQYVLSGSCKSRDDPGAILKRRECSLGHVGFPLFFLGPLYAIKANGEEFENTDMPSSTIQLRTVRDDDPSVSADVDNIVEEASWDKFDDSNSAIATTPPPSLQVTEATVPKEGIRHRTEVPPRALEAFPSGGDAEEIELYSLITGASGGQGTLSAVHATPVDPERGSIASLDPSAQALRESVTAQDPSLAAVYRKKSLVHFLALCGCMFVNGWNDATTGPMLPRIQEKYNVRID